MEAHRLAGDVDYILKSESPTPKLRPVLSGSHCRREDF